MLLFALVVACSRLAQTMMREAFSVSPGGRDRGADLSQFCDSCTRPSEARSNWRTSGFHRHCERSEAIQNLSAEGLWIASLRSQ
ncbi:MULTISPECIES: hypothetical protein [Bradyrhizobium]|uniref:hypothetical protein n=1 Tax=Bradyrhizobium TaxID=374 RepID=UPI001586D782|nr:MULTISPECIES: hypothetical protein [Bradyrhizobium]UUO30368.1 hypothetical protein DCG74_25565 [Bradyrhizobium sp. WBAH42]